MTMKPLEVLVLVMLGALLGHLSLSLQAEWMWDVMFTLKYSHKNKAFIIFHPILLCWLFWLVNADTPKWAIRVNPKMEGWIASLHVNQPTSVFFSIVISHRGCLTVAG